MGVDPISLAVIGLGVASTVFTAVGQRKQAKAEEFSFERNAEVAREEAKIIEFSSEFDTERLQKQKASLLSRQRSLFAKSGVRSAGSPLEVAIDSATELELDILTEQFNAGVEKTRVLNQVRLSEFQAGAAKRRAFTAPALTVLSSIPSTVSGIQGAFRRT